MSSYGDSRDYADVRMVKLQLALPGREDIPLRLVKALLAEAHASGVCCALERAKETIISAAQAKHS